MKDELRKKYKSLRKSLSEKKRAELSLAIFEKCFSEFYLDGKNISVFIPIKKFNEIDTWHYLDKVKANFFLPVVKNKTLKHIKYENKAQLKLSDWGILEPTFGDEVDPSIFDFVIVPLLGFDKLGNRIGYGAGFYDGFLKDCNPNCKFIGVSFFEAEETHFPTYPTDIPLDFCITPNQIYKFD